MKPENVCVIHSIANESVKISPNINILNEYTFADLNLTQEDMERKRPIKKTIVLHFKKAQRMAMFGTPYLILKSLANMSNL